MYGVVYAAVEQRLVEAGLVLVRDDEEASIVLLELARGLALGETIHLRLAVLYALILQPPGERDRYP